MLHGYGIDVDDLITEMNIFQRLFASGKALISVAHVVNELKAIPDQSKKMFPLALKVIKMLLVVPATSATAERSFSTMKRVKSYLRSAMGQERLNDLCLLSVYKEQVAQLNVDSLVEEFSHLNVYRSQVFGL